jgi:hypothetical protein
MDEPGSYPYIYITQGEAWQALGADPQYKPIAEAIPAVAKASSATAERATHRFKVREETLTRKGSLVSRETLLSSTPDALRRAGVPEKNYMSACRTSRLIDIDEIRFSLDRGIFRPDVEHDASQLTEMRTAAR